MISLAAAQIILIVVFVVYIAERYEGLVPDPIYSVQSYNVIFVIGIFAVLMINLSLSIFAFQMRSIFSLRHRLLKRAASREMRR